MRFCLFLSLCLSLCLLGFAMTAVKCNAKPLPYTGVSLAGGEFYDPVKTPNPVYGKNFVYPTASEFHYFASKGMNVFRVQFLWETLQPVPKKPFRPEEIKRLQDVVALATSQGLTVLLDPHNYARYYGKIIGGPEVGDDDFADFWGRMAQAFKGNPHVWFGLVNEPHDMPTTQWLSAADAAIAAIRAAKAHNLILVPGNGWTGAGSWLDTWYGGANGVVMLGVHDPENHYAFEVHQYLDPDGSGTHTVVSSPTIGVEKLKAFTAWCRLHKKRAFLGEFAVPATPEGQAALEPMLTNMEQNSDVWLGYTWWAAGALWGDYMFTLEPKDGVDRPQMAWLRPHLQQPR
jgi:endoglucanase